MNWMTIISLVMSLFSTIAATLAWIAKLRWAKEYTAAKDAQIESLKNEIQILQDLSPIRVREYFVSVKAQLEEYIEFQKKQIQEINFELLQKDVQIKELRYAQEMQHVNIGVEMENGIDSTLEGWVRSVGIFHNETDEHLNHVIEMTVKLAEKMGIQEEQIIHIRRGALLHDIGKIKVPAHILHKQGPLTENEWDIYRQHPEFSYELISPIEYLQPALDIPRFHHEKWDGTGYPKGLKGEEIPLAARIFAVVDVWDALSSDRLNRAAWSNEKALEYIHSQSGVSFDPQIVNIFMNQ
jgi:HD-GYP domain-containing protein (c-di-GMP phosphodiesterase class II)